MSRLYRMDHSGHGLIAEWQRAPKGSTSPDVVKAADLFARLRQTGAAIAVMDGGEGRFIKEFDPNVDELLVVPAIGGG